MYGHKKSWMLFQRFSARFEVLTLQRYEIFLKRQSFFPFFFDSSPYYSNPGMVSCLSFACHSSKVRAGALYSSFSATFISLLAIRSCSAFSSQTSLALVTIFSFFCEKSTRLKK